MAGITLNSIVVGGIEGPRLDGLDLHIEDGEFLSVIGPSGSGKTTLLRVIAGLETPERGDVLFDDVSVVDTKPYERDLAMVFQDNALIPFRSVRGNVAFPLEVRKTGRAEIDARVGAESRVMAIDQLLRKYPGQIGAGHQQLVQAARALVRRPTVFLLDEPLARVDPALRIEMRSEIKLVAKGYGVTAVYATNDPKEAMALGDRIAVLDRGRLIQIGTPDEVYHRPVDRFVAEFVGSPSMSMVPVTADATQVTTRAGSLPCAGKAPERSTTMGVRPEDWEVVATAGLPGTVGRIENHGDHWYVTVDLAGTDIVMRTEAAPPAVGDRIEVWTRRFHLFDRSGRRVATIGQ
jgi:multiple sugar transport system ATP-binding protein